MTNDWVHGIGRSLVCQILLKIVVRAVIAASPSSWTSFAWMLSTRAAFPFFFYVLHPPLLCEGWVRHLCLCRDRLVLVDLHWSCDGTAQCCIISIGSVFLVFFFFFFSEAFS